MIILWIFLGVIALAVVAFFLMPSSRTTWWKALDELVAKHPGWRQLDVEERMALDASYRRSPPFHHRKHGFKSALVGELPSAWGPAQLTMWKLESITRPGQRGSSYEWLAGVTLVFPRPLPLFEARLVDTDVSRRWPLEDANFRTGRGFPMQRIALAGPDPKLAKAGALVTDPRVAQWLGAPEVLLRPEFQFCNWRFDGHVAIGWLPDGRNSFDRLEPLARALAEVAGSLPPELLQLGDLEASPWRGPSPADPA